MSAVRGTLSDAAKLVGVGLSKTGTTTLGTCMRQLGSRHVGFDADAVAEWHRGDTAALLARVAQAQSFDDFPWCLAWREIDRAFPGSRFVLTTRRDAETWYESLCVHAQRSGDTARERRDNARLREMAYGFADPMAHRSELLAFYERHNAEVRAAFAARPGTLLEVCWETGSGWRELAAFLGIAAPDLPLPHANARLSRPRFVLRRAARSTRAWLQARWRR